MSKKLFSKIFVLLLVVGLLFAVAPTGQAQAATITVESGQSIQAAITAASTGDTITVAAGTYTEDLVIDKAITLQGAGRETTIIQGILTSDAGVVTVSASNVTIDGFTFKPAGRKGIRIPVGIDAFTFTNNRIDMLENPTNLNGYAGIETNQNLAQTDHVITGNEFIGNGASQMVYYGPTLTDLTFTNNQFTGTMMPGGLVLGIENLSGTFTISGNTFADTLVPVYALFESFYLTPEQMNTIYDENTWPTGAVVTATSIDFIQPIFVDDNFTDATEGWGVTHFDTIQGGINAVGAGGTVNVADGTYAELLTITKPLTLLGPNAGIDGTTGTRNPEALITFPEGDNSELSLIDAESNDITINGFSFTNNQIENTYSGGWDLILIGEDIEFTNNRVISQAQRKIAFKIQGPFTDLNDPNNHYAGAVVKNNYFESKNTSWSSVIMQGIGATVQNNTMVGGSNGIQIQPYSNTVGGIVSHNNVSGHIMSIWHNFQIGGNGLWIYEYNNVGISMPLTTYYHYRVVGTWGGIRLETQTPHVEVRYNSINGENDDYTLDTGDLLERISLGVVYRSGLYAASQINVHDNEFVNVDQNVQNLTTTLGDLDEVFANNTFEKSAYIENSYLIYTSIQDAIDAASDGDTILVGPGTYAEAITLNKPNITVKSTAGAATNIIDVPYTEGVKTTGVKVLGTDLGVVTFDGFTVKNFTENGIIQGTGSASGTSFHVLNNTVIPFVPESGVPYLRDGIQVSGDGSTVKGNYVEGGYLTLEWGSTGILVVNASNVLVEGNIISWELYGLDMGIDVLNWGGTTVSNITITGNTITGADYPFSIETYGLPVDNVNIDHNIVNNYLEAIWAGTWGDEGTEPTNVDASGNYWGSEYGPQSYVTGVTLTNWATDDTFTVFAPTNNVVEISASISVPGGIHLFVPGLTYHLAADTVIQNDSPCFVIEASNTRILAEPGAKCIPTGESNGIDVAADLNNITIDGLEIDGSVQTTGTADGIHFAGAVSDFVLADNKIHNMLGDGIEFVGTPTGVMDIQGNLFQNNAGLGINAGTFEVLAQYNSWGSFTGPVVDTDITSAVNAIPFTHADVTLSPIYGTTDRVVTSLANVSGRPTVLKDGTLYHLWYGPTDITLYHSVSTNPAEFPVGQEVTFSTTTPLEVSSTAIFKEGETFYMVAYDGANNQAFAIYSSTDGTAWTYQKRIFDATDMTDLGKIDAPFVFNDGTEYKLYFQKKSALGDRYDIYLASSTTVDGSYTLNATNPVLSPTEGAWDGKFVMHPWVVKDVDTYYMWYSAYRTGVPQEIGLATSLDGITWTKSTANPVIGPTGEPTVINDGGTWRIWYLSGATIKYQTALSPLDLRQTLAYQVTANLVNVNAADVTISYPTDLLTIAELTSGTDFPGTFDTSVAGQISYVGAKLDKTTTTGEDVVLFNAIFLNKALGSGDIAFGLAEFGMPGYLSSSNVYLAAEADTAEVEIKELPFLTTDLDSSYYLTGESQTFTVTITNYGTAYTEAVLDLTLPTGVTVDGVPATIDLAAGETKTLTLTFTSTTPGEKTIRFDLVDSLGALLFSTVETATVYDKPTISSTDIQGYYLTTVEQEFSVTLDNPLTGGDYAGVLVDLKITGATLADISSLYYWETALEPDGWAPWTLTEDGEGNLIGTFGPPATGFPMTPDYSATTPFKVTFANPGDYQVDLSLRDVDTGTILATFTDTAVVYTQPTITSTLAGPYVEEVPADVTFTITNPSGLPGPFDLVLDLPEGTTVVYNGVTYTCDASGCVIPIPEDATFPLTLDLMITFPDAYDGTISASLVDTSTEPDRTVATFTTPQNVVVLGAFDVNGTVSMQGRSAREGVQLILTGTPGTYDAFSSSLISNNYVIEDVAAGTYTFTTYQPRYLNITADLNKKLTLSEAETLNSLWLRGGNAVYADNVINHLDSGMIANGYTDGIGDFPDADVNFDGKINIQDLALVGGNYFLTSADAYTGWDPVTP